MAIFIVWMVGGGGKGVVKSAFPFVLTFLIYTHVTTLISAL